jgi:invasion protein IalB
MRVATLALTLCLPLLAGPSAAMAQTAAAPAPAKAGAAKMDKTAISKACSQQADAKQLHGKARKEFRSKCKQHGGTTG